ncbi:hypothetical protein GWA01_20830 [Gluconobacter wancherniae NBRC 103581]|uniref:Uncharacterized protein n=1 Tax=Gluconobacter wancherniae NBRC 103581 TaxID=656744 RepID=A0A511B3S1_9PROT|nr:hypothetical protein GWA01_20830 [Gluconobacter wancherniae NBRC 103581]
MCIAYAKDASGCQGGHYGPEPPIQQKCSALTCAALVESGGIIGTGSGQTRQHHDI